MGLSASTRRRGRLRFVDPSVESVPGAAALLKPVAEDARDATAQMLTPRSAEALGALADALGADVDANLDAIRADYPLDVDCRAGCDACCHLRVQDPGELWPDEGDPLEFLERLGRMSPEVPGGELNKVAHILARWDFSDCS